MLWTNWAKSLPWIEDTLNAACASLQAARQGLDQAFIDASNLRKDIEETITKTQSNIFERRDESATTENEVVIAIEEAQKDMLQVLSRLIWWQMVWRVDEISNSIATAVSRSWCCKLEKKVISSLCIVNHGQLIPEKPFVTASKSHRPDTLSAASNNSIPN